MSAELPGAVNNVVYTAPYTVAVGPTTLQSIREKLDAPIPRDVISKREAGAGVKLDYLEGWYVIARMNEVFGQGNWSYKIDSLQQVFSGENNGRHVAHYIATVTVTALGTSFTDVGYGDGMDRGSPGKPHELATKEAVTDAIKRACKNFGMSMGLALYDKSREFVTDEEVKSPPRAGADRRAAAKQSEGSKDAAQPAQAAAPAGDQAGPSAGEGQAVPGKKAKTRDELNQLIRANAKVAISKKKFADMSAVRAYMQTTYKADAVDTLGDSEAKEFLNYLETLIRS